MRGRWRQLWETMSLTILMMTNSTIPTYTWTRERGLVSCSIPLSPASVVHLASSICCIYIHTKQYTKANIPTLSPLPPLTRHRWALDWTTGLISSRTSMEPRMRLISELTQQMPLLSIASTTPHQQFSMATDPPRSILITMFSLSLPPFLGLEINCVNLFIFSGAK